MDKCKPFLFYITLFLLIAAICVNAPHYDFDLWARLIAGMGVVDGGHVLKQDFLSYTPTHIWYDHEYGSGIVFYSFLKLFGPYSLIILEIILYFGIFFTASRVIKLGNNICPYNILFYLFPVMALVENFNNPIRCHLFSFLLFAVFIYILELARKGNNKPLFLIPLLVILWNNLHGGVVAGIGLVFMYAVGEFLNKKPVKKYIITLLVSIPVLIINPWGYDYIKFLLMANTMKRPDVAEWWGLFSKFHLFRQIPFKIFMFGTLASELILFFKGRMHKNLKEWYINLDKTKFIVLTATLYLAISHIKLLPFFAIAGTCFMYEDFYKLVKAIKMPVWKDKVIYSAFLFITLFTFLSKDISVPVNTEAYPVKEIEFIKINNIKGNLLINFGLGSYASYKLYPQNLIFMDGRYEEVYYDGMVPLLKKFYLVNPYWNEILEKFPPDVMVIEKYYPIYEVLSKSKVWCNVFEGEAFGVFVPAGHKKQTYKMPSNDIQYYKNTLFDTSIKF